MTRYYTEVADELLPAVRSGERMPPTLRHIRDVEPGRDGYTIVELEDDEADPSLAGRIVTPTISTGFPDGDLTRTPGIWVSERNVGRPYVAEGLTQP